MLGINTVKLNETLKPRSMRTQNTQLNTIDGVREANRQTVVHISTNIFKTNRQTGYLTHLGLFQYYIFIGITLFEAAAKFTARLQWVKSLVF